MSDATRLLTGLRDYKASLEGHVIRLREQHERLGAAWALTRDTYRGSGAEAFAEAFERASHVAVRYTEVAEQMLPMMSARIAALEQFDATLDGE